jgi:hypothetical protein
MMRTTMPRRNASVVKKKRGATEAETTMTRTSRSITPVGVKNRATARAKRLQAMAEDNPNMVVKSSQVMAARNSLVMAARSSLVMATRNSLAMEVVDLKRRLDMDRRVAVVAEKVVAVITTMKRKKSMSMANVVVVEVVDMAVDIKSLE